MGYYKREVNDFKIPISPIKIIRMRIIFLNFSSESLFLIFIPRKEAIETGIREKRKTFMFEILKRPFFKKSKFENVPAIAK